MRQGASHTNFSIKKRPLSTSAVRAQVLTSHANKSSLKITESKKNLLEVRISLFFVFIPVIVLALVFSLPPINSRNSDPESHSRLFSPPTHCGSCLAFLKREDFSSFFPRRLASNCAYPRPRTLSAVDPFVFLQINSKSRHGGVQTKSRHGGIRTHGSTLFIIAFEGCH